MHVCVCVCMHVCICIRVCTHTHTHTELEAKFWYMDHYESGKLFYSKTFVCFTTPPVSFKPPNGKKGSKIGVLAWFVQYWGHTHNSHTQHTHIYTHNTHTYTQHTNTYIQYVNL